MDVYVLFLDREDDTITVHATLEGAMAASPGEWVRDDAADGVWMRDLNDVTSNVIFKTVLRP